MKKQSTEREVTVREPQVWRTMQELQGVLEEKRKLEAELSPEEAAKAVEGLGLGTPSYCPTAVLSAELAYGGAPSPLGLS